MTESQASESPSAEVELRSDDEGITGTLAIVLKPGTGGDTRARLIDDALAVVLHDRAAELGLVLAAAPSRFVCERPGRDDSGRTVLDVFGRIEGDRLVPLDPTRPKKRR